MSNEIKEESNSKISQKTEDEKPFPYNVRKWVPDIETEKIISSLKHPHYLTRVVQYNILCDSLLPISTKIVEEDLVKLPYVSWENRRRKILLELKNLNADLISIIEFERDENFIKELNSYGYEFAFKPRTGKHSEGCAIAWKNEKYELIDLLSIGFNISKNENQISDIFNRDNIAIIGILKLKEIENTIILFSNTHPIFNARRGDIKLGQIYQLINSLEQLRKKYEDELKNKVYIIFASDLNSIPKSGIYKLLTTGEINCNKVNKIYLSGQDPENLKYVEYPNKIRSYILNKINSIFIEDKNKKQNFKNNINYNDNNSIEGPSEENKNWFNEICRFNPIIKDHKISLEKNEKYEKKDNDLILKIPFVFKSAYATMAKNFLEYFNDKYKEFPFNLIDNMEEFEINGLKMGKKELEKTNKFVRLLSFENPFSYYSNDTVMSLDFIFYYTKSNDVKVARILHCPDMFKLFFEIGYMPNEIFPSDHLSLAADIILGGEK